MTSNAVMTYVINHPRIFTIACMAVMYLLAMAGIWLRKRLCLHAADDKDNLTLVVGATLTLLGLVIGFTFSMAGARYDQRRLYEEAEANAIGTEYVRADLLPPAQATVTNLSC